MAFDLFFNRLGMTADIAIGSFILSDILGMIYFSLCFILKSLKEVQ
jgi:hypothetical protein